MTDERRGASSTIGNGSARSGGPLRPSATPRPAEPLKHVIAEYKHQAQTITCVCGWHGASSTTDGRTSEWTIHLAANRPKPRS